MNFERNINLTNLKLCRYQCILGKVASVKGKVPTMFTSGARLVNTYMYQIFLRPPIDTMLFHLDFVEFQILANPHPRCQELEPRLPVHLTRPLVYQKLNLLNFKLDQCRNSPRRDATYFQLLHQNQ